MAGTVVFWVIVIVIGFPVAMIMIGGAVELLVEFGWKVGQYYLMIAIFAAIIALAHFF